MNPRLHAAVVSKYAKEVGELSMFFPDELLHELEEAAAAWALVKAFRKLLWNQ